MNTPEPDQVVDARGLSCPLPILRAKQALAGMSAGQVLLLQASDRGAEKDVPAFCRQAGVELLETHSAEGVVSFYLRKSPE